MAIAAAANNACRNAFGIMLTVMVRSSLQYFSAIRRGKAQRRHALGLLPLPTELGFTRVRLLRGRSRINPTSGREGWGEGGRLSRWIRAPSPARAKARATSPLRG